MTDIDQLKALGQEIKRRRLASGIRTLKRMSELTNLSTGYLSQLERGYDRPTPDRDPTTPSDKALKIISDVIDMPLPEMHMILGRIPQGTSFSAVAINVAIRYEQLPPLVRRIVDDALSTAEAIAIAVSEQYVPREEDST